MAIVLCFVAEVADCFQFLFFEKDNRKKQRKWSILNENREGKPSLSESVT